MDLRTGSIGDIEVALDAVNLRLAPEPGARSQMLVRRIEQDERCDTLAGYMAQVLMNVEAHLDADDQAGARAQYDQMLSLLEGLL